MTRLSLATEFRTGSDPRRIERLIAFARAAVAWERLWPALWPASAFVAVFAAIALFDLFRLLPWPLHALVLAAAIVATGLLLDIGLARFHIPSWEEGARRLERDSQLAHRPISEGEDEIAAGKGDPWAEELWRAHLRARLAQALRLRLALPRSHLSEKDPRGFRFIVILILLAGAVFAGRSLPERLATAFLDTSAGASATMDAWIDPPAYTGEAPIFLGDRSGTIAVPTGSIVNLRVHGADHVPGLVAGDSDASFVGRGGEYATSFRVANDARVRARASGRTLGDWYLRVVPDDPPQVAFAAKPSKTERGALKIPFIAGDDYGVVSVRALIRPHGKKAKTLSVDLPLASLSAKTVSQTSYQDLSTHPYAGLEVDMTLEARDAIGQMAHSKTVTFRLPARVFTDPLARALIEQRQKLATGDAAAIDRVALALDAFTIAPERFYADKPGVYTALRAAYWALKSAHREPDVEHVEQLLWQLALALEQNGLLAAAQQLRQLQQMLAQALAQGAPQEVIDALLQRYQEALQRYLQSMAQNAPQSNTPVPPGTKMLTGKDLQDLLKAIQQMAQAGDRQSAMQMLALLQDLLENMRMAQGSGQGQGNGQTDKALSDAINGLSGLMGQQRALLDKTFREGQGTGDPKDGGPSGLAQQQGQLRDQLNKVLKGLGDAKKQAPKDLGEAGRMMGQSQQQLGNSDTESSGESQKQALQALQKGAQALAKQLMDEARAQNGEQGQSAQEDPLGRGRGIEGNVKIPSQSDLQRARGILQELRKRAGERGRPKEELDYIDRLLKEF